MTRNPILSAFAILAVVGTATAQWTQASPAASSSARAVPAATFDPVSGLVLLYGGSPGFGSPLGDTWTYDGTTWTQLSLANAPRWQ